MSGYLAEILVPEGDTVDVGTRLAVISADAPAVAGTDQPAASTQEPEGPAAEPAGEEPVDAADGSAADEPVEAAEEPAAEEPAPGEVAGEGAEEIDSDGPEPVAEKPVAAQRPASGGPAGGGGTRPGGERPPGRPSDGAGSSKVLSPVVRRLIAEHGPGPEPDRGHRRRRPDHPGRRAGADRSPKRHNRRQRPSGPGRPEPPSRAGACRAGPEAAAKDASSATRGSDPGGGPAGHGRAFHQHPAPHRRAHGPLQAHLGPHRRRHRGRLLRRRHRPGAEKEHFKASEGFSLTYLPFISRAVIDAIAEWPNINSSVGDDELIVHNYVNLGIAVDLNFEGLLVPVIHDADGKRLRLSPARSPVWPPRPAPSG